MCVNCRHVADVWSIIHNQEEQEEEQEECRSLPPVPCSGAHVQDVGVFVLFLWVGRESNLRPLTAVCASPPASADWRTGAGRSNRRPRSSTPRWPAGAGRAACWSTVTAGRPPRTPPPPRRDPAGRRTPEAGARRR